ncbi:MAG: pyruvate, phosphate dikinase [Chloroflexi bacterium]|nr:pyruvate, phosphate dikinase [Chloroflexota bacterium]
MSTNPRKKWAYLFAEADPSRRDLLGGKGAGLAQMTSMGLPVPPGFTITTEACLAYYESGDQFPPGLWEQTVKALGAVEKALGKKLGDPHNPLLVSVRSGARFSMPGMMDTVLNLGLNSETVAGLGHLTGDPRFAYDSYRRFLHMFGKTVLGLKDEAFEETLEKAKARAKARTDADLSAEDLKALVQEYQVIIKTGTGQDFPSDPMKQLELAIKAVFASWNNKRAIDYRTFQGIPHNLGTAVNVQAMVFGNLGADSASGVAFTRDPATGEKALYGEYLANAQGEDVVAGIRTPRKISDLKKEMPQAYRELERMAQQLEREYRDAQDLEFTIEHSKLYMLQTRSAKRTAPAAVKMAVAMVAEGLITKEEALLRVEPAQIYQLLLPRFDETDKQRIIKRGALLARGLNASPGAASGAAIFDADRAQELGSRGESVILVRPETNPDDVHGMLHAKGILTARGGATSHAAVVARGLGKPCVSGCETLKVDTVARTFETDGRVIQEGEEISLDGSTGEVFQGHIATVEPKFSEEKDLVTILDWANQVKRLGVWANADYPTDAAKALEFGAEGIGLCRTEHMFFQTERLPIVHKMILAAAEATALEDEAARLEIEAASTEADSPIHHRLTEARKKVGKSSAVKDYHSALAELGKFQTQDFAGLFRVMAGRPVIIRLIDPPLHEFLPKYEDLLVEVTKLRITGESPKLLEEKERLLQEVDSMREMNPMLGLRGIRLSILFGAIADMQVRAILSAACQVLGEGIPVHPEIMIPLVGHVGEIKTVRERLEVVAQKVQAELKCSIPYKFGTMIELPRAALTADEIARYAEFFSFGTNDLTQTTYGISRDDAEGKFLLQYVRRGILPENPFQVLDRQGVGKLIRMAVELGRKTRPELHVGICGEHGGDPSSIQFCHEAGLDYVSCSPYRVPVARLAAAQAALEQRERDK